MDIVNFRVHLERVTSSSIIPQALADKQDEEEEGESENVEMQQMRQLKELQKQFGGQKEFEEFTFQWQQKVFSKVSLLVFFLLPIKTWFEF